MQGILCHPEYLSNNKIPVWNYLVITVLFFSTNLCNNMALSFDVDMPTMVIIRSGTLVANMIVSIIALRRTYTPSKFISVATITIGVILSTVATASVKSADERTPDLSRWTIGMSMLLYGLFGSATTGVFQEKLFEKFGKHPGEAVFYINLLGVVGFLPKYQSIAGSIAEFTESPALFGIPSLWLYCGLNIVMQNICLHSVYFLLSEWTSLAVTLVTTVRKFVSLVLSVVLFGNVFTTQHGIAAALVFLGTAIYSNIIKIPGIR